MINVNTHTLTISQMVVSTYFDSCTLGQVDGIQEQVLSCTNFMGAVDKHVLYRGVYSSCEYHYCALIYDRVSLRHNTISCSGGVMRFNNNELFLNPITPFILDFAKMIRMPVSAVELLGTNLEFYYAKDVRTTFALDIVSVNCTNSFKTCLTFTNTSVCFGNLDDTNVVNSPEAMVWGAVSSLVIGALFIFVLLPNIRYRSSWFLSLLYFIPLVSVTLLYMGIFLGPTPPFIISELIVFMVFHIIHYSSVDHPVSTTKYTPVSHIRHIF
jgi:hypothetical protein